MTILPGKHLGPYEILSAIGAGGMGEVYRARDTILQRDVAVRVLPEIFAADASRMARFEREAQLLASLNHHYIAAIYGVEESDSCRGLVMELVEGPTLADRVALGPIPMDEALAIAKQVAEAVEYAHDHGVIHRDLKPANIKVTAGGKVKVLDFGLAKALQDEQADADLRNSPTLNAVATMQGVILGVAAYMSPEQAKGEPVDRRADIWAFGVVLVEMLTGKPLYKGENRAETLASVVTKDPSLGTLPANTPPAICNMIQRCLNKDPRQRLRDIGEARIILEDALSGSPPTGPVLAQRKTREQFLAGIALIAVVVALALAFLHFRRAPEEAQPIRFFVSPPETWTLAGAGTAATTLTPPLAVSPDGHRVAFVARSADGRYFLWIRSLDTIAAHELEGTDGASSPFWSPDSRFLGFFAGGKLKKIEVSGGPPTTLCDAPDDRGGTWSRDGLIVFAPTAKSALQKVSATGGVPTAATVLGPGETSHFRPFFLPDGRHFLYRAYTASSVRGPIYVATLDSTERKMLLNSDSTNVLYTQGHLLFMREKTLMAQAFDARRLVLTGEAIPLAEQTQTIGTNPAYGDFSASDNAVLAYQTGASAASSQLAWFDRTGKQIGVLGDLASYSDLELSPDGKRASVSIPDEANKTGDIWVYDVARGRRTRFTFDAIDELASIWSPDGSRIVYNSRRRGHLDLVQKASNGSGAEEVLLEDDLGKYPLSWSPDGRFILYLTAGSPTGVDLFALPLSGDRMPIPFLNTKFNEGPGQFSPDGRWVAYRSNESGMGEVYVAPFPGPGGRWQISTAGGTNPRWRRDGQEIFYLAPDNRLMAVAVSGKGASFEVGTVKALFQTRAVPGSRYSYDVSPDGQRFLINTAPEQGASAPITVVLNWSTGLKK